MPINEFLQEVQTGKMKYFESESQSEIENNFFSNYSRWFDKVENAGNYQISLRIVK